MTLDQTQKELDRELCRLPSELRRAFRAQLITDSMALGLWTEVDGLRAPIPIPARPWLVDQETVKYLHQISWQLRLAMRLLPNILNTFPEAQQVVPLNGAESHWLQMTGDQETGPGERLFCRIDAVGRCRGSDWRNSIKFVETNVVGIGGMTYAPAASEALMRALEAFLPSVQRLEALPDPRILLMDELRDHARCLELSESPRVALMDDLRLYRLGGEMARLAGFLKGLGMEAEAVDARDFHSDSSGRVLGGSQEFDLIYRFLELRELDEIDESFNLQALHRAFREGRMIPSMAGELDHKSCYELFTDPKYRGIFSDSQLEVFDRHVLWTRLIFERRTTAPSGEEIDLFGFLTENQDRLVIKPNRSYGGIGVVLGPHETAESWTEAMAEARRNPGEYVVQELAEVAQEELPLFVDDGSIRMTPCFLSLGLFPTCDRLGALGRYSGGRVVNISQEGGVIPLALAHS
jgi:hypothetical protein